ncbi:hypothetical protein [Flavobacterium sp. C3NV]|uniref:hypothetical protein n=1 Tax=Flavobacterium sp. C3NV TaxID=3393358 RepID=UPI00398FE5BB
MNIKNKQLIKDTFTQVVERTIVDEKIIADFFHSKYQQNVDGVQLDYSGFIQHMKAQKSIISNITVNSGILLQKMNLFLPIMTLSSQKMMAIL